MEKRVNIAHFFQSMEFEMAKSYLESCGIQCFGRDEIINRAYISNVNDGVKLDVLESQAEEAVGLLLEKGYLKKEDFEPSPEFKWAEKVINFFKK
ncbi:conserved hypothetical protein [uncultured Paludibacter sp.]|nr:conserved hypothetical protein [uncultured Paludibacter sp.]